MRKAVAQQGAGLAVDAADQKLLNALKNVEIDFEEVQEREQEYLEKLINSGMAPKDISRMRGS